MRQIVLMWLFWICVSQSLLRYPIKRLATYVAQWGEPPRETLYKPARYVEGSWRD